MNENSSFSQREVECLLRGDILEKRKEMSPRIEVSPFAPSKALSLITLSKGMVVMSDTTEPSERARWS